MSQYIEDINALTTRINQSLQEDARRGRSSASSPNVRVWKALCCVIVGLAVLGFW
jgi:hypothetical protein